MYKEAEVQVIFKDKDKDGDHEDLTIKDIDIKTAKKIYKKLIRQWKTKRAVQIFTHEITVASDAIFVIVVKSLEE